jgi:hypothetical protein
MIFLNKKDFFNYLKIEFKALEASESSNSI